MKCFAIRCLVAHVITLLALALPADANDLGRLFFSTDQRQTLNQKRSEMSLEPTHAPAQTVKLESTASQAFVQLVPLPAQRITGRVTRSSGNNTVWVNQTPSYVRYSSRRLSKE